MQMRGLKASGVGHCYTNLFIKINTVASFSISGTKLLKRLEFTARRGVKVSFVIDILMR